MNRFTRQAVDGLSPLARGTHHFSGVFQIVRRFIPAGAGNTLRGVQVSNDAAVYPRWRGEHSFRPPPRPGVVGLSPLARGTH
ncbi:hypothetical protein CDS [Salmonella enterica subsp. enterica serovar Derby]|nr:hypothetical protein CDS [Salmonella enterica subsp. enterica serovar Derby]